MGIDFTIQNLRVNNALNRDGGLARIGRVGHASLLSKGRLGLLIHTLLAQQIVTRSHTVVFILHDHFFNL